MTIKVLHVFPPGVTNRFGGQTIFWKYCFSHWNNPDVEHYVLDDRENRLLEAKKAFLFEYPDGQKMASKWERAVWILSLFRNLIYYKDSYDILHMHVLWWGGLLVGIWARWKKVPALYESILLDGDTPGGIVKQNFGRLKLWCLKSYKAILAISDYLAEEYRKFGFSEEQIFTLMNCVDVEMFSPPSTKEEKTTLRKKFDIPNNAMLLVFVGSIKKRKGVDVLMQSFIEAGSKNPDLYLLLIGPKDIKENPSLDDNFIHSLVSLLNENEISNRAIFAGLMQDRQKLAEMYRAADIFVFPSTLEGLGNVVLEAMASELPVITTQLPVLEKVIEHERNGYFVPVGDARALEDAILMLSDNPQLAKRMGIAARQHVSREHSFAAWQAQLSCYYGRLIFSDTFSLEKIPLPKEIR